MDPLMLQACGPWSVKRGAGSGEGVHRGQIEVVSRLCRLVYILYFYIILNKVVSFFCEYIFL